MNPILVLPESAAPSGRAILTRGRSFVTSVASRIPCIGTQEALTHSKVGQVITMARYTDRGRSLTERHPGLGLRALDP